MGYGLLLLFYLLLGARDWGFHDSAELAAGCALLGIVHPPGYPLYLLLGHLLYTAGGVASLTLLSSIPLVGALAILHRTARRRGADGPSALSASLVVGLAPPALDMGLSVEVYALYLFFLAALDALAEDLDARPLPFFAVLGLALAHHIGILILLPAFLPEFLVFFERARREKARRLSAALAVIPGPLLYLLLPLFSARQEEFLSWGPVTWKGLLHYATGGPFRAWMYFPGFGAAAARLVACLETLFSFLPALLWPVVVFGLVPPPGRNAARFRAAWFLVVPLLHLSSYHVLDLAPFLTPALVPLHGAVAAGLTRLRARFSTRAGGVGDFAQAAPALAVALALAASFLDLSGGRVALHPRLFEHRSPFPAEYGRDVLAVYGNGETIHANWRYFPLLRALQLVEGRRTGAVVRLAPDTRPVPFGHLLLTPDFERAETAALVMEGLAWRAVPGDALPDPLAAPPTLETTPAGDTPVAPGVRLVGIDLPETAPPGRPRVAHGFLAFARDASAPPEAPPARVVLHLGIARRGRMYFSTPLAPISWHLPPAEWEPGKTYVESIALYLPPHLPPGEYEWVLVGETGRPNPLGRLVL